MNGLMVWFPLHAAQVPSFGPGHMFFFGGLYNLLAQLVASPPPAAGSGYGFRWRPGMQAPPATLSIYDADATPGGLYVVFIPLSLGTTVDPFNRFAAGPVFPVPAAVSAGLRTLIRNVSANPPPGEAVYFANVTQQRLLDTTGYLTYAAACLAQLEATVPGAQLLAALDASRYPVFITPGLAGMNQTRANDLERGMLGLVTMLTNFEGGQALDRTAIDPLVTLRYPGIARIGARYTALANDINTLPLYSLVVNEGAYSANFLRNQLRFRGAPVDGTLLFNWAVNGFGVFDVFLRTSDMASQGVKVREFFLLALVLLLGEHAPAGAGCGSSISFDTHLAGINVPLAPGYRPPVVGLAHEMMHSMHYAAGTATGAYGGWSGTAAELLFSGIQPYQNEPVSENTVRAALAPPVARRTVYSPPRPNMTVAQARAQFGVI